MRRWGLLALLLVGCTDASGGGDLDARRPGPPGRDATVVKDAEVDAEADADPNACRLNSDCQPGLFCNAGRCSLECRVDRDCPRGLRCASGECLPEEVEPPPPCMDDGECGPPASVCEVGTCVAGCVAAGCEGRRECDGDTGRCVERPDCADTGCAEGERCDASGDCLPADGCVPGGCGVRQRCDAESGRCVAEAPDCRRDGCGADLECDEGTGECVAPVFDCRREGCPMDERCDQETGGCVPAPQDGLLGGECDVGADCESDICLGLRDGPGVCSRLCCDEAECPLGTGCLYYNGVRVCVPGEVVGFEFDRRQGQACRGVGECQSDLCDETCLGTCCTNDDCGGRLCVWEPTFLGENPRAMCSIPLGFGRTGDFCGADPLSVRFDCASNICVFNPNAQAGQPPGICADLCCTHGECPDGFGCGQVQGPPEQGNPQGNVVTACVPLPRGLSPDGDACAASEACLSGHCVEAACRQPCCTDAHCPQAQRCLPRVAEEGVLMRVCVEP